MIDSCRYRVVFLRSWILLFSLNLTENSHRKITQTTSNVYRENWEKILTRYILLKKPRDLLWALFRARKCAICFYGKDHAIEIFKLKQCVLWDIIRPLLIHQVSIDDLSIIEKRRRVSIYRRKWTSINKQSNVILRYSKDETILLPRFFSR